MEEEVNDKSLKRQRIIDEDRFKQQMGALKGIATLLNKPEKTNDDKQIIDAINKQGAAIEKVAAAIQNQPKPEKPEVNVQLNNTEVVTLLREVKEGQIAIIEALENKPMVDEFKFISDQWGKYNTAKVVYTPANKITFKK